MAVLSGSWIRELSDPEKVEKPMISPCQERNRAEQYGKMSYGVGPCGYDAVLSPERLFLVTRNLHRGLLAGANKTTPVPEKQFENFPNGRTAVWIEPGQLIQAEILERFALPTGIVMIPYGKSSYTRQGLQVNATIGEPGWNGVFGVSITNPTNSPIAVFLNEGLVQFQFQDIFGDAIAYAGKYQDAKDGNVLVDSEELDKAIAADPSAFLETEDKNPAETEKSDDTDAASAPLSDTAAAVPTPPAAKVPGTKPTAPKSHKSR